MLLLQTKATVKYRGLGAGKGHTGRCGERAGTGLGAGKGRTGRCGARAGTRLIHADSQEPRPNFQKFGELVVKTVLIKD